MSTSSGFDEVTSVLATWRLPAPTTVSTPLTGVTHETLLLETTAGAYALRTYRYTDRAPIEHEHAVILHARGQGAAAIAPLPLPAGETILERGGRYHALYPRARGMQLRRDDLGIAEAALMGQCLAEVHQALRSFPGESAPRRSNSISQEQTLADITMLEQSIRARPTLDQVDHWALARLAGRRAWLVEAATVTLPDLAELEHQVLHGDYQESNLFFEGGQVSAVIDWDHSHVAPREWEIVRALDLVFKLQPRPARAFLCAYQQRLPVALSDLDLMARWYSAVRAHDLWLFKAVYLEGNERARRFIYPGAFVPFGERWASSRAAPEWAD